MSRRRKKRDLPGLAALCALITLWICAIMLPKAAQDQSAVSVRETRPTLILDPGHGGMDGGASAQDGTYESRINLEIALRTRDLCRLLGVPVTMTREKEDLDYPEKLTTVAGRKRWDTRDRVERIDRVENGILLSVHQNYYPSAGPCGAQVFYAGDDISRSLAELIQLSLQTKLMPENRRGAEPVSRNVYIMNHVRCPAVLVECGFLSNPREAALLQEEGYQIRIAAVLSGSFLRFTEGMI